MKPDKTNIGQQIIKNKILTREEADVVYQDLITLETKGVWNCPDWAGELSEHYSVCIADTVVQRAGWRAISISLWFRNEKAEDIIGDLLNTMEAQEYRENGDFHWSVDSFKKIWNKSKLEAEKWLKR